MAAEPKVNTLEQLLVDSKAAPEFKDAVRVLARSGVQDRIKFNAGSPPVKVLRLTMKILESLPEETISSLEVKGSSGCSNYIGSAVLQPGNIQIQFDWDCRWMAEQVGWKDFFGEPDQ